ncbi:MAG TPA: hypothetical protein VK404_14150, partial [Spirosoma sp.]|nr:hypothetical protein [Spirosoma sp.]
MFSTRAYFNRTDGTYIRIADKRDSFTIGRPRRSVYRSLTAIEVRNNFGFSSGYGHQSQVNVL